MSDLPLRTGSRPKTHFGLPHEQLDQNPPTEIYLQLKNEAFDFPLIEKRPSIISVPGTEALWLTEKSEHHCAEAFMQGNEFAHIHPPYDGSMHMMLPESQVAEVIEQGWGEIHPLVQTGDMPPTLLMVYGPRDLNELNVITGLLQSSYKFARGI